MINMHKFTNKELREFLRLGELRVVGSILHKEEPRDLDLVLVLEDNLFEELFMSLEKWKNYSTGQPWCEKKLKWNSLCIGLSKYLTRWMSGTKYGVDLRIQPRSCVY